LLISDYLVQSNSDLDLTDETVKARMKKRYGDNIPRKGKVISPVAMLKSEKLIALAVESYPEELVQSFRVTGLPRKQNLFKPHSSFGEQSG
jgi:hypothetical protein